jgi:pimeloyl-ACP methyl ester carboxylesterase
MGAKTAMTLACKHHDRVSCLVTLDTYPVALKNNNDAAQQTKNYLEQLMSLQVEGKTRKTAIDLI